MNQPITTTTTISATTCGNCNTKETFILHNVRVRGVHRRLCTGCVLRSHPSSFCPFCFSFYDSSPPSPPRRLPCTNCTSFSHSLCASHPHPTPFLCPPCSDPNFSFFSNSSKIIDKQMATVLLCAAQIASSSMSKAVNVARTEAERRVREAALCRKRAREALEHVVFLSKSNNKSHDLFIRSSLLSSSPPPIFPCKFKDTNNHNPHFPNNNTINNTNVVVDLEANGNNTPNLDHPPKQKQDS